MEQVALAPTAVNLPNLITYGRIAAVPAVVACLFFLEGDLAWWSALVIFILAAVPR